MTIKSSRQSDRETIVEGIRKAAETWPDIIPRKTAPRLIGETFSYGTLANFDSEGNGVPDSFRLGRQICYFKVRLVEWLISRLEVEHGTASLGECRKPTEPTIQMFKGSLPIDDFTNTSQVRHHAPGKSLRRTSQEDSSDSKSPGG
jgi:hypothetical protein